MNDIEEITFPEKVKYKYQVCAVIFGADKSVLNIKLKDDYSFILKSIYSKDDDLTELFQTDVSGLQRNYYSAIVDNDYKVICIEKIIEIELNPKTDQEFWDKANIDDLSSIDDQLRTIRLIKEGPIRCKSISFNLKPIEKVNCIIQPSSHYSLFQFSGSYPTKSISTISCDNKDIDLINKAIENFDFPLQDQLLNSAHIFYDLSYHTELYISVSLLTTALEMLYLNNEQFKKEKLSKRCAVYIGGSNEEIIVLYKQLKEAYSLRSKFLHDGNIKHIRATTVIFLRDCVRKTLLKSISTKETKNNKIKRLKEFVKDNLNLFGE